MKILYQPFLVCLLLSFCAYNNADQVMKSNITCFDVEREALLAFKQGITYDIDGIVAYWEGEDCCHWGGVKCSNHSDSSGMHHVIGLVVGDEYMGGEISPHLGNLSSLENLDLSSDFNGLKVTDPRWLGSLTSLVTLNLSGVQLDQAGEGLFQSINKLPSLVELQLIGCALSELPYSLPHINFTSLALLDLSYNHVNSSLPPWFFNLKGLEILNLYSTGVGGQLPTSVGNLCKLKELRLYRNRVNGTINEFFKGFSNCSDGNSITILDLRDNQLEGEIPTSIGILKHLQVLSLSNNSLSGPIPQSSIAQLQELIRLELEENHYEGFITELLFLNLTKLEYFSIGSNKVIFNITLGWMPPFRLTYLHIINCHVGPKFPKWIRVQSELRDVILRNVSISDILPVDWIHNISSQLSSIDLSENQFMGKLPERMDSRAPLILSHNNITGQIPSWIYTLSIVQLSNNQLSGPIPECLNETSNVLEFLDVSNNDLSGMLPSSMFLSTNLKVLSLSNNRLQGRLPASLQNSSLGSLDVGENMLSGTLPTRPPASWVLRLRSNSFHGAIPEQWCDNAALHVLDLAHNNLSGPIPQCINNLTALWSDDYDPFNTNENSFNEHINEITKGIELKYTTTTQFLNIIDLSRNNLAEKIPVGLMNLTRLGFLNLSMNHFIGRIPENVGNLQLLEMLDLSNNSLSGEIPQSIASMTKLNYLNLSYNKLEGRIPSGRQLETLNGDLSIYNGNPLLCGLPLPRKCHGDEGDSNNTKSDEGTKDGDGENFSVFFMFMGAGYVFGLCGIGLVLWFSVSFRQTYFGFFRLY